MPRPDAPHHAANPPRVKTADDSNKPRNVPNMTRKSFLATLFGALGCSKFFASQQNHDWEVHYPISGSIVSDSLKTAAVQAQQSGNPVFFTWNYNTFYRVLPDGSFTRSQCQRLS